MQVWSPLALHSAFPSSTSHVPGKQASAWNSALLSAYMMHLLPPRHEDNCSTRKSLVTAQLQEPARLTRFSGSQNDAERPTMADAGVRVQRVTACDRLACDAQVEAD